MNYIPEIETVAHHVIEERIRRRRQVSRGRRLLRRRAASALRRLADALSPPVRNDSTGQTDLHQDNRRRIEEGWQPCHT